LARRWVRVHERIEVERRRSEDDLRESEERYRELFENANDAIATLDLEGRITSANKALECISGYPRDELVGKRLAELLAGESQDLTPERSALEVELVACDGRTTTLEVGFRPIEKDGVHVGTQLIARDVSERRRLEEQLRQSQKMEAIGQLAGGVAHDFNNLLLAISGYTQLALDRVNGDAALGGHLREVSRAADRAAGLTRQLLAFSRKQILQPRVFDLNAVVADMNDMLRRLIGEHIELVTALDPALAPVEADVGQIEQVLMNLAVNARDAMPAGGTLTISTASIGTSSVQFAIADTGCGMDAATREKAFEPFFTTKDPGKGTGLGLSTVYGIVEQSGGQVTIESEPGRGTTFRVALPATGRGVENGAAAAPIESSGSETILLVEDEDVVRELTREMLERYGYTVLSASDSDEALAVCGDHEAPIDLLLTDVVMPKLSARELATRVRILHPEARLLYMSGYADDAVIRHGVIAEGTAFLQKPFAAAELARKVREVLDGSGAGSG
jgi:PAS domain S-box-containing protein